MEITNPPYSPNLKPMTTAKITTNGERLITSFFYDKGGEKENYQIDGLSYMPLPPLEHSIFRQKDMKKDGGHQSNQIP